MIFYRQKSAVPSGVFFPEEVPNENFRKEILDNIFSSASYGMNFP
jgi:hypothetical protein